MDHLFAYAKRSSYSGLQLSYDLSMYLISKINEDLDPRLAHLGAARFFSFDNMGSRQSPPSISVIGWIGKGKPERVVRMPQLLVIDMVRDAYSAYPLFTEKFAVHVSSGIVLSFSPSQYENLRVQNTVMEREISNTGL